MIDIVRELVKQKACELKYYISVHMSIEHQGSINDSLEQYFIVYVDPYRHIGKKSWTRRFEKIEQVVEYLEKIK